ncbi:MAG: hypothetical protein ACK5B6_09810 [Bacteroidia bacterium]|jgi:hypothetical protein
MEQTLQHSLELFFRPLFASKFRQFKTALAIGLMTLILSTPRLHMMNEYVHSDSGLWTVIIRKSKSLTDPLNDIPQASHAAKKKLRLTVPFLAAILHLNAWGIYIIQFILGFFSIFFFLALLERIIDNHLYALLLTASFAFIFAGKCAFVDISGHLDAWPFFFALATLFTRFRLLQLLLLFAVIWSDERGYILAFIACIAMFVLDNYNQKDPAKESKTNYGAIIPVLAIPLAVGLRLYLTNNYGLGTDYTDPANEVGLDLFFRQIEQRFFLSALIQFEGFWILFLAAAILLYQKRFYIAFTLFTGIILLNTFSSFIVGDIIRSASYGFPLIFISLLIFNKLSPKLLGMLVILIFTVCFIIPPFQFLGEQISYYSPFPFHHIYFLRQFIPF